MPTIPSRMGRYRASAMNVPSTHCADHQHLAGHQYDTDAKNAPRGSEYSPIVIRFIT